jgi:hypothetical protein
MVHSVVPGWNREGVYDYYNSIPINEIVTTKEEAFTYAVETVANTLSYLICRSRACVKLDHLPEDINKGKESSSNNGSSSPPLLSPRNEEPPDYLLEFVSMQDVTRSSLPDEVCSNEYVMLPTSSGNVALLFVELENCHIPIICSFVVEIRCEILSMITNHRKNVKYYSSNRETIRQNYFNKKQKQLEQKVIGVSPDSENYYEDNRYYQLKMNLFLLETML